MKHLWHPPLSYAVVIVALFAIAFVSIYLEQPAPAVVAVLLIFLLGGAAIRGLNHSQVSKKEELRAFMESGGHADSETEGLPEGHVLRYEVPVYVTRMTRDRVLEIQVLTDVTFDDVINRAVATENTLLKALWPQEPGVTAEIQVVRSDGIVLVLDLQYAAIDEQRKWLESQAPPQKRWWFGRKRTG